MGHLITSYTYTLIPHNPQTLNIFTENGGRVGPVPTDRTILNDMNGIDYDNYYPLIHDLSGMLYFM